MGGALSCLLGVRNHGAIVSAKTPTFVSGARMDYEAGLLATSQPGSSLTDCVTSPVRPSSVNTISATVNLHRRRLMQSK